jgi:MFS family permease
MNSNTFRWFSVTCASINIIVVSAMQDGPFVWEKEVQGHILGAFFYGYMFSQIPGGLLAERFGAKWIIAGFLGLSTVATLLTPIASQVSFIFLIFLRVLCGIGSVSSNIVIHSYCK